jgi:hypothetical protein
VWIIAGTSARSERVPGGAKLEHYCQSCRETTMFYEKQMTDTFRLYFIDVYDISKQRVMACGACGAHYLTDDQRATDGAAQAPAVRQDSLGNRVERGVQSTGERVGGFFERTADSLEAGIGKLLHGESSTPPASRHEPEPLHDDPLDEDPLDDPNEAKFRELERKAGLRR